LTSSSFAELFVRLPSDISFAEKFKCAHRVDVKFAHLLWYVRTKENVDKGSGAMSDAPATPQEQADDAEDRFIKQVLLRTAIRQQKSNEPNNGVHAYSVLYTAMRNQQRKDSKALIDGVQQEIGVIKQLLRKVGNALVETNDAAPHAHANPTSMSLQVPAQVTTTPSPMPAASANKPLPHFDRVPSATNVPSFIERYEVDMLNVAGVKARFGLNNLDSKRNGKLASRVTSARAAAKPYRPLFETLQFLIGSKQLAPNTIQTNMVATVGQTRSIRAEFKRMARVLAGVDGVENRAEALKKAWNVPDPK